MKYAKGDLTLDSDKSEEVTYYHQWILYVFQRSCYISLINKAAATDVSLKDKPKKYKQNHAQCTLTVSIFLHMDNKSR